ncbi:MAG: rhodanese-like domain-containing protein [Jaaginema sp. PMC 1080.18]|nr:rhodanese-like domain-containing protein [Jaaginema sp. PMC 1080.18]MEC4864915.1 rhodanese-like domain-containing protein [Jaaginema sp. PMC 1078.18]
MTTTQPQSQTHFVDARTLKTLLDRNKVEVVDVREPGEYAGEHIPGSKSFPLSKFDPQAVANSTDKQVILYCQSGNRSNQAAQKMLAAGYSEVTQLQGGINAWKTADFEVNVNKNAPISIMRQVQIVAGSLVLIGTLLGAFVSPWFLILSGFVGAGLTFAGISNTCLMAHLLAKLPYNQRF